MVLLLFSCEKTPKITEENQSKNTTTITQPEIDQTELIVQKILDLPELQWIYHTEIKETLPVKVLESQTINKSLNLNKFGQKVIILSRS